MARQAATASANDRGDDPDRFHNQDERDRDSLAQSVDELEAVIRYLEERVASMNVDLTYQIDAVERHGDRATRQLALEVAEMGEALSRRIRDQPENAVPRIVKASPRRSPPVAPLTLGLSGALVAALSALGWSLFHHPAAVTPPKAPAPSAPALYAPTPPAPPAVPIIATDEPARAPPHYAGAKPSVHHSPKSAAHNPRRTPPTGGAIHPVSTATSTDSKAAASPP